MEYENKYASNAKGNLGVTLGAVGAGAALLNGGLNGVLGSLGGNYGYSGRGWNNGEGSYGSCDHFVNRYEAGQSARIAELETEVKLRDSTIYTDQKTLDLYKYFDGEIKDIRNVLSAQAVHNQKTEDSFELVHNDLLSCKNELYSAIARERDDRCCADNAIVNYANATFYPKMVADVTVGTETTAQAVYNPIPNCGCGCNRR